MARSVVARTEFFNINLYFDGKPVKTYESKGIPYIGGTNIVHWADHPWHTIAFSARLRYWKGFRRYFATCQIYPGAAFIASFNVEWRDDYDEDISSTSYESNDAERHHELYRQIRAQRQANAPKPAWNATAEQRFHGVAAMIPSRMDAAAIIKMDSTIKASSDAAMYSDWLEENGFGERAEMIRMEFGL